MSCRTLPGVEVMRPGRNIGFAAAVRAGSLRAAAAGADWVWVFNNDALATEACLERLLAAAEAAPRAALLSPVIAFPGGSGIWYAGGDVRPRSLSIRHWTAVRGDTPYPTGFVTGCAPLVRTAFILEQGPPDQSLFMYYEDVDWCLRALSSGWQLLVVPGAVVEHDVEFDPRPASVLGPGRLLHGPQSPAGGRALGHASPPRSPAPVPGVGDRR